MNENASKKSGSSGTSSVPVWLLIGGVIVLGIGLWRYGSANRSPRRTVTAPARQEDQPPFPSPAGRTIPQPADLTNVDPALVRAIHERVQAVRHNPNDPESWGRLGIVYEANGYHHLALDCYATAYDKNPKLPRWRYHWALIQSVTSNTAAAESALREVIQLDPGHAPAYEQLGRLELQRKDYAGAEAAFRKVIELRPGEASPYAGLAEVYIATSRHAEALPLLDKAIALAPRWGMPHFLRGRVYQHLGGREEAAAVELRRGAGSGPSRIKDPWRAEVIDAVVTRRGTLRLARQRIEAGLIQPAMIALERLLKDYPHDAEVVALLAEAYVRTNRIKDAQRVLDETLSAGTASLSLRLQRSTIALRLGDPQRALAEAEAALQLAPTDARTFLAKGNALAAQHRTAEALTAFLRSRELDPSVAVVHAAIGRLLMGMKRYREAIAPLERAVELDPRQWRPMFSLGLMYGQAGRLDEAIEKFRAAKALNPTNRRIQTALDRALSAKQPR